MSKKLIRHAMSAPLRVPNPVLPEHPHRVKQEFKKEVDINEIVGRMKRGIMPPPWMTSATPRYGDLTEMPVSFMEAYDIVQRAEEAFDSLPLELRRAIDHDPRRLNELTYDQYKAFGLLKTPEGSEAPNGASEAPASRGDASNSDRPAKAKPGAKKGIPMPGSTAGGDPDEE